MRYRLSTLMLLSAVGPPVLALLWVSREALPVVAELLFGIVMLGMGMAFVMWVLEYR